MPTKYRSKPESVEAVQVTPFNSEEIESFVGGDVGQGSDGGLVVATTEGPLPVIRGEYIAVGGDGVFFNVPAGVFESTYEVAI